MGTSFTFCPVTLNISEDEFSSMLNEVRQAPAECWYEDQFRGCSMLPIYNGGGKLGPTNEHHREFQWSKAGEHCPITAKILTEKVFPFLTPLGRTTILKTQPHRKLNIHLDCRVEEVGTSQYKFRMVLGGQIDKLFFLDENLERKYVPGSHRIYIIDGSHPHGLEPSEQEKITLCIGAPWGTTTVPEMILNRKHAFSVSRPQTIENDWQNPIWKHLEAPSKSL